MTGPEMGESSEIYQNTSASRVEADVFFVMQKSMSVKLVRGGDEPLAAMPYSKVRRVAKA